MDKSEILYLLIGLLSGMYINRFIGWLALKSFVWLMLKSDDKSEKTVSARKSFRERLDEKLKDDE